MKKKFRKKTHVRPNSQFEKNQKIKPTGTGSSSAMLWEALVVIVLIVCCLWLIQQMFLHRLHHKNNADNAPEETTSESVIARGDWEKYMDKASNEYYYYNTKSKRVVWDPPLEWLDGEEQNGWIRWYDNSSSSYFYENSKSKALVWEPPFEAFPEDFAKAKAAKAEAAEAAEAEAAIKAAKLAKAEHDKNCRESWCRFKDESSSKFFYQNEMTKETSWAVPIVWKETALAGDNGEKAIESVPEAKDDWIRIPNTVLKSKNAPKFYYFHQKTKQIQWEVPDPWKTNADGISSSSGGGGGRGGDGGGGDTAESSGNSNDSSSSSGLRGGKDSAVVPGTVERGGWVQVKDVARGKFYYYEKGQAQKTPQWETPPPFVIPSTEVKVSQPAGGAGKGSTGSCSAFVIEENMDIKSHDIGSVPSNTVDECCAKCNNHPGCKSFTFAVDTCWMKSILLKVSFGIPKNGVTSAFAK
jgi:uncharacterized membrane protein YgcG